MKKITKEEFKAAAKSKRRNPLAMALDELAVGEGLKVEKSEYKYKAPIYVLVGAIFRKEYTDKKFKVSRTKDESGWVILRIK